MNLYEQLTHDANTNDILIVVQKDKASEAWTLNLVVRVVVASKMDFVRFKADEWTIGTNVSIKELEQYHVHSNLCLLLEKNIPEDILFHARLSEDYTDAARLAGYIE